jgi:ATP-dependent DNA helicase RecQ
VIVVHLRSFHIGAMSVQNRKIIQSPAEALKRYFGFDDFLDGQEEVVDQIVSGRDGLVVMPTGGGKSLCYQLPALCFEGVSLVVSPLIALMKDQVDALVARGIAATMINSTLSWEEQKERLQGIREGRWKLVYVAPERFRAESFLNALQGIKVELFAVDEAHCLSQWGHDFRPDYLRLGKALEKIGRPQCVALTATATPIVRADIIQVLQLREGFEQVSGFARPNLSLNICTADSNQQKEERLKSVLSAHRTGIVYCATRKKVEAVSETISSWGLKCVGYHGGMSDEDRERAQNVFINKQADVAVATNAFGMGIDRSDVRFVVHYEIPGSVEAYYQEAGRAGRDGESAYCELLYNYADTKTQEFFIDGANPGVAVIRNVYQFLLSSADGNHEIQKTLDEIAEGADVRNSMAVGSAMATLGRSGYIERFDLPGRRMRGTRLLRPDVFVAGLQLDETAIEEKDRRDREKLRAMVELCYARVCRQQWILEYFGEQDAETCGNCDFCRDSSSGDARKATAEEDVIVKKILSGVARMSRKNGALWEGKFGRGKIVQMLLGGKSQEVLGAGLNKLSTYGILKELGSGQVNGMMRSLADAGLLRTEAGEFPVVTLTDRGEKVMLGKSSYSLIWPKEKALEIAELKDAGFDPALFGVLRDLRARLAKAENVPAYCVFGNKTIEALARYRPRTIDEMLLVPGVGAVKAQRYARPFLDALKDWPAPR